VPLVRSLLIACLFALPIAAAPAPQDAQLVDRFVALLERDDMTALHELAPDSVDPMRGRSDSRTTPRGSRSVTRAVYGIETGPRRTSVAALIAIRAT